MKPNIHVFSGLLPDGYRGTPPPAPVQCRYCGAILHHEGYTANGEYVWWMKKPEKCPCDGSGKYYLEEQAQEQAKIAQERAEEERRGKLNFEELRIRSGIKGDMVEKTFEAMDKTGLDSILPHFRAFIKEQGGGLYLCGPVGVGKTHLAIATGIKLMQMAKPVIFRTAIDLVDEYRQHSDSCGAAGALDRMYRNIDILILDDLGKENHTDYTLERLYSVVDARYQRGLPIIVTSNMSLRQLPIMAPNSGAKKKLDAIASRLSEMCREVKIVGEDRREHKIAQEAHSSTRND